MKHWMSRVVYALGVLGIALACIVISPAIAKADTPDVRLPDLQLITGEYRKAYTDELIDNYDNGYSYGHRAVNYTRYKELEYLLDSKYARFTATLYVSKGNSDNRDVSMSIVADGKEIYSSPILTKTSRPVHIDVDVKGVNDIRFIFQGFLEPVLGEPGFYRVKPSDMDPVNSSGQNIFRMYNPYNGEHLYTTDTNEADSLLSHGWNWEGTSSVPKSGSPVYRLCNPYSGEHLYTTSFNEYKTLSGGGWNGEGEKFYSADSSGKPFYRIYNPWGSGVTAHTYTTDKNELDTLTRGGWKSDGVCWYGIW